MIAFTISVAVIVAGMLPPGIHARHCFTNDSLSLTNEHRLNLTHPDQLLALDGCTSLAGNIYLQDNFTGAIVLNGVTNFTGILGSNSYDYNLDSVEMLNVKYMQELDLHSAPRMNRVAMPRLERIEHLSLQQYPEGSWFDFAALKFAGRVYIYGSYENVTFPALEISPSGLVVWAAAMISPIGHYTPAVIDLPALTAALALEIHGNISSLSLPELETLGPVGMPGDLKSSQVGLEVESKNPNFPGVFLPSLRQLSGSLTLESHITALDMPGVRDSDADISITSESPMKIYSSIERVKSLSVNGEIAVINLPNLTNIGAIDMSVPGSELRCPSGLVNEYRRLQNHEPNFCNEQSLLLAGEFEPTPTPTPGAGGTGVGLSPAAERAIIVVGVVVGCVMLGAFMVVRRRRKQLKTKPTSGPPRVIEAAPPVARPAAMVPRDHGGIAESPPRHSADEAPPPYTW